MGRCTGNAVVTTAKCQRAILIVETLSRGQNNRGAHFLKRCGRSQQRKPVTSSRQRDAYSAPNRQLLTFRRNGATLAKIPPSCQDCCPIFADADPRQPSPRTKANRIRVKLVYRSGGRSQQGNLAATYQFLHTRVYDVWGSCKEQASTKALCAGVITA